MSALQTHDVSTQVQREEDGDETPMNLNVRKVELAEYFTGRTPVEIQLFRRDKEHLPGSRSEAFRFAVLESFLQVKGNQSETFKLYKWLFDHFFSSWKSEDISEKHIPSALRGSNAFYYNSAEKKICTVSGIAMNGLVPHFKLAFRFFNDLGFQNNIISAFAIKVI